MDKQVILLSIPGLRERDVMVMRNVRQLMAGGEIADLTPSFPCVTCPVQANMTTGKLPREHGVVGNGLFRKRRQLEMWTSPNECIESPQLWQTLAERDPKARSAVWFPLHSKHCEADYTCTPAPIHNPDGSESLWCYTRPDDLYGELRDRLGHFPLQHFWGPMAGKESTAWIVDSAVHAANSWQPNFFYIYLPHLDYAAQRTGPDSAAADEAVADLDQMIGRLVEQVREAYEEEPLWLIVGEYAITPVRGVTYPNRLLRDAGLLHLETRDGREYLDVVRSTAWALADHQFSHVFVRDHDEHVVRQVAEMFASHKGIDEVVFGDDRARFGLDHRRTGDLVVISSPDSWQAYYWWLDDSRAPAFAQTVDIHRKPGYDPVELHFDPATKSIPLDATLIKGSHGAPATDRNQKTVFLSTEPGLSSHHTGMADTDVFEAVMRGFM